MELQVNPSDLVTIVGELYIELTTLRRANMQLTNELKNLEEKNKKAEGDGK